MQKRRTLKYEETLRNSKNEERIFRSLKFPFETSDGDLIGIGGLSFDITEERLLEAQSYHNAKLASIGELAAGVGHEINNPLALIKGHLDIIRKKMQRDGAFDLKDALETFEKIDSAVGRVTRIVNGLKNFSRADSRETTNFNLCEALEEAIDMVESIHAYDDLMIDLDNQHCKNNKCFILGNRGRLQQVFINLINNARDATLNQKNRTLSILVLPSENEVSIVFRDNGIGISEDKIHRVFDPFFTTKELGKGTGLGLSISHSIMHDHNGDIEVQSKPGQGATFKLILPLKCTLNFNLPEVDTDLESLPH
ncbi:MAG: ATP-binding protein [Bdellovibrionales bacterium]